jgi:hypothetical protein
MSSTPSLTEEVERAILSDLQEFNANTAEVILDSFLKDGPLKEVPLFGSFLSMWKAGAGLKEYFFLQKLIKFLDKTKEVPMEKRQKMIDSINRDPRTETKVCMQIMMLLDRADDFKKASIIGRLFN